MSTAKFLPNDFEGLSPIPDPIPEEEMGIFVELRDYDDISLVCTETNLDWD